MKKFLKPTLFMVPLLALTSCDSKISRAEASLKAQDIKAEQANVDYTKGTLDLKVGIQSNLSDEEVNKTLIETTVVSIPDEYYFYIKNFTDDGIVQYYVFTNEDGLVFAKNEYDATKTYSILENVTSEYEEAFVEIKDSLNTLSDSVNQANEDFLDKLANSEDLDNSISENITLLDESFDVDVDYKYEYISNGEGSLGFNASGNFRVLGLINVTASAQARWEENVFKSLDFSGKVEALGKKVVVASSLNYSPEAKKENINLEDYTLVELE